MKKGHIEVRQLENMPVGQCAVMMDGVVVYEGRIGAPLRPFITEGATLLLNPVDLADGEDFRKNVWNKRH